MIKKVLVVGGAGYVGGAVTDNLISKKIPFSVFDNLLYEKQYLKPVEFIYGDIRDYKKLFTLLKDFSHVIWLAGIVGDRACEINPKFTKSINELPVEWLSKNFNKRIIYSSTCSVYGLNKHPVDEKSQTAPLSLYAKSKLRAEGFLQKKDSLILRLGTAYGISDEFTRLRIDLAINAMTIQSIKKNSIKVYGGKQWRPFIHVKDIGKVIVNALSISNKGVFNVATQNKSIEEIAEIIQTQNDCKIEFITKKRFLDERDYKVNVSKADKIKLLPKKNIKTIEFGVREITDAVLANRFSDLEHINYSNELFLKKHIKNFEKWR